MKESAYIKYKKGFKYQLTETTFFKVKCIPPREIQTPYIDLDLNGELTIKSGYAWDGPSGPTIDTKNFMRGSLVHDALYQLMRQGLLPLNEKNNADRELMRICLEDGMWRLRAWLVFIGVNMFGKRATLPKSKKPIITAPK